MNQIVCLNVLIPGVTFDSGNKHFDKDSELFVDPSFVGDFLNVLGRKISMPYFTGVLFLNVNNQASVSRVESTDLDRRHRHNILNLHPYKFAITYSRKI